MLCDGQIPFCDPTALQKLLRLQHHIVCSCSDGLGDQTCNGRNGLGVCEPKGCEKITLWLKQNEATINADVTDVTISKTIQNMRFWDVLGSTWVFAR